MSMLNFMAGVVINDDLRKKIPSLPTMPLSERWEWAETERTDRSFAVDALSAHARSNGCKYPIPWHIRSRAESILENFRFGIALTVGTQLQLFTNFAQGTLTNEQLEASLTELMRSFVHDALQVLAEFDSTGFDAQ